MEPGRKVGEEARPPTSRPGQNLSLPRLIALGLAGTFLVLLIGCLAWPSVFWDGFVYRYLWASTEADALGHAVNGLTEDYNLVSTLFYGAILAAAVYLIFDLFRKRGVEIEMRYILALVPFVLFGTLARALEDSFYFSLPAAYVFIAPQIYALVGVLVIGLTLLGQSRPARAWPYLWLLVPLHLLFFTVGFRGDPLSGPSVLAALTLVLLTAFLTAVELRRGRPADDLPSFLWPFGLQSLAAPLFLVAYWCAFPGAWGPVPGGDIALHLQELLIIPAIALTATFLLWLLFWSLARWRRSLEPLAGGLATLVILGHMLDAAATFRAMDWFHYSEKHVLAGTLIKATGTALAMFPMKAVAIGIALYVLLVGFREESGEERLFLRLLIAALFVLGLSPGLRGILRVAMGV